MDKTKRTVILGIVLLVVAAILIYPRIRPKVNGEFSVTPDPIGAMAAAVASDKPIFMEFYQDG